MSSSGTIPRATADEVLAALLVERDLVEAELVNDVRAALAEESGGGNIVEALIDSEILPLETAELFVGELARGILTCPGCPGRFNVASLARGARFKCKTCGNAVTVPALAITAHVLGRFGGANDVDLGGGGDVSIDDDLDLPAAAPAPVIEEAKPTVTSDEDAIDQAMAIGTGEGQLLDFTDADVSQETIDGTNPLGTPSKSAPKSKLKSAPRAKRSGPKRSSRRAAAASGIDELDDDYDPFDDDALATKPKPAMVMWIMWVVVPIAACALVMYYTAEIKTWMFGGGDTDATDYYDGSGRGRRNNPSRSRGDYKPSIKVEDCDDWASATASAAAAASLVTEARDAASAGDTAGAKAKFSSAGDKFQEAYEFWDEVVIAYGSHCDHLQDQVDAWVKAHEAADAEAGKLP